MCHLRSDHDTIGKLLPLHELRQHERLQLGNCDNFLSLPLLFELLEEVQQIQAARVIHDLAACLFSKIPL